MFSSSVRPVRVMSPAPRDIWQSVYDADPEAVPYESPLWLDAACQAGHYRDASRLYEFAGGRQFILPMVEHHRRPALLSTAGSMPYSWGMGGLIGRERVREDEVAAVFEDLHHLPYLRLTIRPNPRQGAVWAAAAPAGITRTQRLAHVVNLEGGFEKVWSERFTDMTRRNIRKAERSGVEIECDTTGRLIPEFYGLFQHSIDMWATNQHEPLALARWRGRRRDPLHKFETIAKMMGSACKLWLARIEGKAVAACLVLQQGNANFSRGVRDDAAIGQTRANDLIHKFAIEEACRAGCRYYHMGESGTSAGLAQYKARLGGEAVPYEEYYLERLPITTTDKYLKQAVKRLIGFKD
jgi:hypothetical protein